MIKHISLISIGTYVICSLFRNLTKKHTIILLVPAIASIHTYAQISNPRVPAEWEEVQGIIVSVDTVKLEWDDSDRRDTSRTHTQCQIMKEAINEGIEVYCFYSASVSPAQAIQQKFGIASNQVHYIAYDKGTSVGLPDANHNVTIWLRDTGPLSVYNNQVGQLHMGNWFDDQAARWFANEVTLPLVNLREPGIDDIRFNYTDGGNFLTDGLGNLFVDKNGMYPHYTCDEELNAVNQIFKDSCGITNIQIAGTIDIHTDYYLKLVNEETFVLAAIPESNFTTIRTEIDENDRYRTIALKEVKARLEALTAPTGRKYKVIEIVNAPTIDFFNVLENNQIFEANTSTALLTYTNSLIINKTVLVPQYNIQGYYDAESFDAAAIATYQKLMPGYRVVGINAWGAASLSGAIHCLTHDVAASNPLWIKHSCIADTIKSIQNQIITSIIQSHDGIKRATLYWKTSNQTGFTQVAMESSDNNTYEASIVDQPTGTEVQYYIEAEANSGKVITKPYVAPAGCYQYFIGNDEPTTQIDEPVAYSKINIVPNPAGNTIYFSNTGDMLQTAMIRIYNLNGTLVLDAPYSKSLHVGSIAPGVYIVKIEHNQHEIIRKLIKQ
nr:agmatine deiminase family protein [uncultured Carboxylicivirga sp.]